MEWCFAWTITWYALDQRLWRRDVRAHGQKSKHGTLEFDLRTTAYLV